MSDDRVGVPPRTRNGVEIDARRRDRHAARDRHWEKTRTLTIIVLAIWFVFAFVLPWFARELNSMEFLGFPLGYYFIVQGSLIAFVLLIFIQNFRQDAIDDEFGVAEEEGRP